jgi:diguanylate cyclase (GGDEF)-like protein
MVLGRATRADRGIRATTVAASMSAWTVCVPALLLIDVDHFKAFNDTFGHQPGDHALAAIATCIDSCVRRAGDCAARYGGEEFAVLLPGMSAEEALVVAEDIRTGVERLRPEPVMLTVSAGVASLAPTAAM